MNTIDRITNLNYSIRKPALDVVLVLVLVLALA